MKKLDHVRDKQRFVLFVEKCCETLHGIHKSFPIDSPEREAIEIAAKALLYSLSNVDFLKCVSNDELTQEQREHLSQLGLDECTSPNQGS